MRHPEACARLMRPRPAFRIEPGSTDHNREDWTDACLALGGSSELAFAAFAWCFNADRNSRRVLERHLLGLLGVLSLPCGVEPAELVELALDEQHAPQEQRRDDLRALVIGIRPMEWRHHCRRPHAALLAELDSLAGDAWRTIRQRSDDA